MISHIVSISGSSHEQIAMFWPPGLGILLEVVHWYRRQCLTWPTLLTGGAHLARSALSVQLLMGPPPSFSVDTTIETSRSSKGSRGSQQVQEISGPRAAPILLV